MKRKNKKYYRKSKASLTSRAQKRKGISSAQIIKGIVQFTRHGYCFVEPDPDYLEAAGGRVFIPPRKEAGALHGDRVTVLLTKPASVSQDARSAEGIIRSIDMRAQNEFVAELHAVPPRKPGRRLYYRAVPVDSHYQFLIGIDAEDVLDAKDGSQVLVRVHKFPTAHGDMAVGSVVRVFGETENYRTHYDVVLFQNNVRTEFPDSVIQDSEYSAKYPITAENRRDLRDRIIFTIDSETAKDLDDAISIARTSAGYELSVHIADVSHYVRGGSATDREAFLRGTSIYFIDQVVPMLPKVLSNGVCSLDGGVDRYALSATIQLDFAGNITGCELYKSIINSKIRGVYSELNDIVQNGEASPFFEKYRILYPDVYPTMLELYHILEKRSAQRGALELETSEPIIVLGEDGMPVEIVRRTRGISERLIEQFMLVANEAVAGWLLKQHLPGVFRVHAAPPPEAMDIFLRFAYNRGYDVTGLSGESVQSHDIEKILRSAEKKGELEIISSILLRSLSKAEYSDHCELHFGLAIKHYCHFTSPIRRYPDLSVHRIISAYLDNPSTEKISQRYRKFAAESAKQSSACEIRALTAERDIDDLYRCLFLSKRIGQEANGIVSGIISSGFFVRLEDTCEGFVALSSLEGYYVFESEALRLRSKSHTIEIGNSVRVRIDSVNINERLCDMSVTSFLNN